MQKTEGAKRAGLQRRARKGRRGGRGGESRSTPPSRGKTGEQNLNEPRGDPGTPPHSEHPLLRTGTPLPGERPFMGGTPGAAGGDRGGGGRSGPGPRRAERSVAPRPPPEHNAAERYLRAALTAGTLRVTAAAWRRAATRAEPKNGGTAKGKGSRRGGSGHRESCARGGNFTRGWAGPGRAGRGSARGAAAAAAAAAAAERGREGARRPASRWPRPPAAEPRPLPGPAPAALSLAPTPRPRPSRQWGAAGGGAALHGAL